jgi:hypothetical protein
LRCASDCVVWGECVFSFGISFEINLDSQVVAISIDIARVVAERHPTGDDEKSLYISPGHTDFYALKIAKGALDNTAGAAITSL